MKAKIIDISILLSTLLYLLLLDAGIFRLSLVRPLSFVCYSGYCMTLGETDNRDTNYPSYSRMLVV